jgi:hypothetical protein
MSNEQNISKMLSIVDYYIDNYRYDVESHWITKDVTLCSGFTISSKKGYKIQVTKDDTSFKIEAIDRYGSKQTYLSDNEIFLKFVNECIDRILRDSEVSVLERIDKEYREINIDRVLDGQESKKSNIYGNHEMYSPPLDGHPSGVLMFRNKLKRIMWYVDRDLATIFDETDGIIKARFHEMPNGLGRYGDPYYIPTMENKCVVTGTTEDLNRHHIVPKMYRNLYPLYYKKLCHHDIVAIEVNIHSEYETKYADVLKKELADKYDAPLHQRDFGDAYQLSTLAWAYRQYGAKIPQEKINGFFEQFKNYLNKNIILESDIDYLISLKSKFDEKIANHGRIVLEAYGDLQGFVEMWREHFIECMNPEHMPENWNIKRPIDVEKTYKTVF